MNIAKRTLAYYESEYFQDNYTHCLMEDTSVIQDRIKQAFQDYDFFKLYGENINLTDTN